MRMVLKSMNLQFFKGVQEKVYDFKNPVTRIKAMNGMGKTTIADAVFWVLFDKSYSLVSNPNIRPNNVEECTPTVTLVLDIDGREVAVSKSQKRKVSKPDDNGISKVALSNVYEINSVPKTERDFKAYLEDCGVNFETALVCMHPVVFTSQKAQDMRSLLFKMASEKSDHDIANMSEKTAETAKLLEQYTLDEISAMNKASKKKANEQVEAIPNQIIGLEKAKIDVDVAELELQRNGLKEQIADCESKISDGSAELDKMQNSIMELQFEINSIYQKANDDLTAERRTLQRLIDNADDNFKEAESQHKLALSDIERGKSAIERNEQERLRLQNIWKEEKEKEYPDYEELPAFDETSLICTACGQDLPEEIRKEKISTYEERKAIHRRDYENSKQKFENDKEKRLTEVIEQGKAVVASIKGDKENIEQLEKTIEEHKADKIRFNAEKNKALEELSKLPKEPDMSENQEYERLSLELATKQKAIDELRTGADYTAQYRTKLSELREELSNVEGEIAKVQNNIRIDEQIAELQKNQREYEQVKADAEKILDQLDIISKKKNELLVEDINSHFGVVKWKLFDYQNNGGYKEVCVPIIDGYEFKDSTNGGRDILAQLDICNSFQKFFGTTYPIILDRAGELDEEKVPKLDCQLIELRRTTVDGLVVE